jgi:hypothetical protein
MRPEISNCLCSSQSYSTTGFGRAEKYQAPAVSADEGRRSKIRCVPRASRTEGDSDLDSDLISPFPRRGHPRHLGASGLPCKRMRIEKFASCVLCLANFSGRILCKQPPPFPAPIFWPRP